MITEEQVEKIVGKLIERIEKANTSYLKGIGSSIRAIRELTPTQAQKLIQILKYGGKYEDIIRQIAKYTSLNLNDVDEIFHEYAKKDQMFYKQFYDYRNRPFILFEENIILQRQTQALANIVRNEMYNFTRNNVLGYTINGKFFNLRETYNKLLDEAFLNVNQGKETFDSAMTNIMKQIGGSGIKTLNYESGRSMRLDSAVRMHLQGRLRELHYENQKIIADEIQADGWEISAHANPAPDHEDVQGKQFSIEEYEKLQNGEIAKDYKGKYYTLDKNESGSYRPIREMNCKHTEFSIVLGVSKPEYTEEQLQKIINDNNKGFEFEGKHYTNYEGTQLQRMLERKIREQKDTQILAKSSGNELLAGESQHKITMLTNKYRELSKTSGLPTKMQRAKVSTYRRSATATKIYKDTINQKKVGEFDVLRYTKEIKSTTNDVILTPKQEFHIKERHPEVMPYYDKMQEIINQPDKVYMQAGKRKDTLWLIKEYDGQDIKLVMKMNTSGLYQKKTLGYKNSIITMYPQNRKRLAKDISKGKAIELLDTNK